MAEFKTVNENNVEFEISADDFKLCQSDVKIHDQKFSSKPTTFFKDAMRRFRKNKSSVVGACIIGILVLLAIFIPIISPHDVKKPNMYTTMLTPKLFKTGTGFWDGTKKYEGIANKNIVYDVVNQEPVGFYGRSVVSLTLDEQYTNKVHPYAHGGYYTFFSENSMDEDAAERYCYITNNTKLSFNTSDNVEIKISFYTPTEEVKNGNAIGKQGEYRIVVKTTDETIVLKDWSRDYSNVVVNVSDKLTKNISGAQIRIELKQEDGYNAFLMFETLEITSNNDALNSRYKEVSILDGNASAIMGKNDNNKFPVGYWSCKGQRGVFKAKITYCDFVYDVYDAKLGARPMSIAKSTIDDYIKNGWCELDYSDAKSFKVLSDKCPIVSVTKIVPDGEIINVEAVVDVYKYIGYKNMPIFLLGTNESGYDLITQCFKGLRLSLILSICASSVCILFGLCWGSISGYFGGNVDLLMERFCDILGGVPWIVVMTLAILLLGNNVVTFAMALCLTGWMGTAARTRTQFYRFKGREYILASRTLGASDFRLIFKHILPNALGTIITSSVLLIPSTIFSESTLAYLNLGLQGSDGFGNILASHQQYLSTYPALIVFPAIIISLIMISFNLFGNGLRDAVNPSLKGSE